MESVFRYAFIVTLLWGKKINFAAEFITRYDPDEAISTDEPVYHPIDYRRIYNLRYEPMDKSREVTSTSGSYSNQIDDTVNNEIEIVEENPSNEIEITTEKSAVTYSPVIVTEQTASSEISSSIMRPDQASSTKTAHLIGEGLKNLLYSSSSDATIFQGINHKAKGFLSLFEVFQFENIKCSVTVSDIRFLDGICYHEFECKSLGGASMGVCASGIGVCCVFLYGCGASTDQSTSYFESPNYPTPVREPLICVLIVNLKSNVRQLRLDFPMFELNRPTNGECLQDQFIVSGQNVNFLVPILCGINTGQHMYIDVENAIEKRIFLSVFAKGTNPRSFNIKISQLERGLAPDDCLQFYSEPEGLVKSFNYDRFGTIVDTGEVTYLNNMNYAICIKRVKQMCTILYSSGTNSEEFDFQLRNRDEEDNDIIPEGQAGAGALNCPDDFIVLNQIRLCGERINDGSFNDDFTMNADIRDTNSGPIIVFFRSNNEYVGRGFHIQYKQEICI